MVNEIRSRQNTENVWWPWIASFGIAFVSIRIHQYLAISLGLMLLFLNWLRMGKPKKVLLLSVLSMFYIVLLRFTDYGNSTFNLLDDWWSLAIWGGQVAITLIIIGLLSTIGWNDIHKFVERGEKPIKIPNLTGVVIAGSLLAVYLIVDVGLDLVSQKAGRCKFPTVYDLVAESQESNVSGLSRLLVQRKDMGCDWEWSKETNEVMPTFSFPGERKVSVGWNGEDYYYIEQVIMMSESYNRDTVQLFLGGNPILVELIEIPDAVFYQADCIANPVVKNCIIILGLDDVVYGLDVRGVIISDSDNFEAIVNTMLTNTVEQILEYETARP